MRTACVSCRGSRSSISIRSISSVASGRKNRPGESSSRICCAVQAGGASCAWSGLRLKRRQVSAQRVGFCRNDTPQRGELLRCNRSIGAVPDRGAAQSRLTARKLRAQRGKLPAGRCGARFLGKIANGRTGSIPPRDLFAQLSFYRICQDVQTDGMPRTQRARSIGRISSALQIGPLFPFIGV